MRKMISLSYQKNERDDHNEDDDEKDEKSEGGDPKKEVSQETASKSKGD